VYFYFFLRRLGFHRLPKIKGLFATWYYRYAVRQGVVTVPTVGGPIAIDLSDDPIAGRLVVYGEWEADMTRFYQKTIRPGMRVVDCGAHVGYFTVLFSKLVGKEGRIYSFEPDPVNRQFLYENTAYLTNCVVYPYAVSDGNGTATLFERPKGWFEKHNRGMRTLEGEGEGYAVTVTKTALDDCIPWPVDLIKLDIEGHEAKAWRGMEAIVRNSPGIIVVSEVSTHLISRKEVKDIFDFIHSLGLRVYTLEGREIQAADVPDKRDINIICKAPTTD
jgi:FkbM family methyltransferase